ncbi:hypothetical protein RCL1_003435 [Eukaryota sp. TZLM3-RCL]
MTSPQLEFEQKLTEFRALQEEASNLYSLRTKFLGQQTENEMVLSELNLLDSESKVFKLSGPVLLPQDLDEAKTVVRTRIGYITRELFV